MRAPQGGRKFQDKSAPTAAVHSQEELPARLGELPRERGLHGSATRACLLREPLLLRENGLRLKNVEGGYAWPAAEPGTTKPATPAQALARGRPLDGRRWKKAPGRRRRGLFISGMPEGRGLRPRPGLAAGRHGPARRRGSPGAFEPVLRSPPRASGSKGQFSRRAMPGNTGHFVSPRRRR